MSTAPSFPTAHLVDRLPPEPRERLLQIGREGRGIFGAARFQSIFETHLSLFEYLASAGATAVQVGHLLAAVGITRDDGTPLPAGTVSSALSRARERAARAAASVRQPPAEPGMDVQVTAAACKDLQRTAGVSNAAVECPPSRSSFQHAPTLERGDSSLRLPPNGPAGFDLPATTRRTAALLEQLRSENDESI
jgi:hypothetical protein